ncbi:hypothetical protein MTR_4g094250 [Medicago truncatula]|uniref:Uncharacterized protein n=1 Tax=Medicago truncatula TaxID=3880 RepID=G7JCS3_MEDTR|nr:hypothetical protein MTR_4g094250 [Medicago truncatula]
MNMQVGVHNYTLENESVAVLSARILLGMDWKQKETRHGIIGMLLCENQIHLTSPMASSLPHRHNGLLGPQQSAPQKETTAPL